MPFLSRALTRKKYPARCHSSYVHGVSYVFFRVRQQLETMWGLPPFEQQLLKRIVKESLAMTQNCLNAWKGRPAFSVLNASHYCIFLQFMRQMLPHGSLSDKLYLLCRMLHSVDLYSAILPPHIYFEHPVGTVMGRSPSQLGDYLTILQGVTLGGSRKKDGTLAYPVVGSHVIFYSHSTLVGDSSVGDYLVLSTGCCVINDSIPAHSLVFGTSPNLVVKTLDEERYWQFSPFAKN